MRVFERKIHVYEGKQCKVEVEGRTVSVQWAFKDPTKPGQMAVAKGVMPHEVAAEFALVLADAIAGAGEVVNEANVAVYTPDQPAAGDSRWEDDDVPVANDAGVDTHTVRDSRRVR